MDATDLIDKLCTDRQDSASAQTLLSTVGVSKFFPGIKALKEVSIDVRVGETLGLIGENGAGKSTLFNVLSGVYQPDEGQVIHKGEPVRLNTYHDAARRGIFRVFQEQGIIGQLTVYENMCLGMEEHFTRGKVLQPAAMKKHAIEALGTLGLTLDVTKKANALSFSTRQLVEVTRVVAMSRLLEIEHPVALLDEPTAALSGEDLEVFFRVLELLRSDIRASIVFISHRLEEVLRASDRIYVMKDGAVVCEVAPTAPQQELHRLMVGREQSADYYDIHEQLAEEDFGEPVLTCSNLTGEGFRDFSMTLRGGEIVGIGGVLGSGKTEVGKAIFGAEPYTGSVQICGSTHTGRVQGRIASGVAYIPIERHAEGILLGQGITENLSLAALPKIFPKRLVNHKTESELAKTWSKNLSIKATRLSQRCDSLSGGNQQKVVLAKWLAIGPKILIADNPTRGVDPGVKEEIYRILRRSAREGVGILLISDDLVELIGLSNKILLMKDGEVTGEVDASHGKPDEHEVVKLMV